MKKILVTGASGFMGTYFIGFLKKSKFNIKIYGIDKVRFSNNNYGIRFIQADLLNRKSLFSIIKNINPDYIFHFAGLNFDNNYKKLLNYNVIATMNLFDAVLNNKSRPRILLIGSAAEYGIVPKEEQPISELTPLRPITPYGVSKAAQDLMALQYYAEFGLDIIIARTFNTIGPGQTPQLICGSIVGQIKNICYGTSKTNKLIVGNLYTKRDFIDIRDVVRAYWGLITYKKINSGEIFNIGSGKAYSIKEIIGILFKHCGREIAIKQDIKKVRRKDIPCQVANITKIKEAIEWNPLIPIELSLQEMYKHKE